MQRCGAFERFGQMSAMQGVFGGVCLMFCLSLWLSDVSNVLLRSLQHSDRPRFC